jgi:hypothetical protein
MGGSGVPKTMICGCSSNLKRHAEFADHAAPTTKRSTSQPTRIYVKEELRFFDGHNIGHGLFSGEIILSRIPSRGWITPPAQGDSYSVRQWIQNAFETVYGSLLFPFLRDPITPRPSESRRLIPRAEHETPSPMSSEVLGFQSQARYRPRS